MNAPPTEPTPRPWKQWKDAPGFIKGSIRIVQEESYDDVCEVKTYGGNDQTTDKANAALIVRAVNSHDALVEALEGFVHQTDEALTWDGSNWPAGLRDALRNLANEARAALQSARREQEGT